ncbi:MAG: molybdopterin molybdotransferase MoeA [Gaiellaceae bacterium]
MPDLLSLEEALACILERSKPLSSEIVPLERVVGRVVAEPALARADLPPFPSSAMDGFAVRGVETPGTLPIALRVAAGSPSSGRLEWGSAAAIATGGSVPEGADTIVPVEQVVEENGHVRIAEPARADAHIRPRGGDVREGEVVLPAGVRIGPAQIGALAAAGVAEVRCFRRPRVSVLATGSELRAPGETLAPGQIFESNRATIAAVLDASGAEVDLLPVVRDDESAHRDALERALAADVLVSSGGVSMGPHDLVRRVAGELGVEEIFWGVAVKPGKPLSFGIREDTLAFGLPGNPVSALVGALVFVRPALLALQGLSDPRPRFQVGRIEIAVRRNEHRDEFIRARLAVDERGVVLEPVTGQESHMIVRAAAADALLHVPRGAGEIATGDPVRYLDLS